MVGGNTGGVRGGDDNSSLPTQATNKVDEEQEPLALLVVHAAMHLLFLPQFTCDFYENKQDPAGVAPIFRRSDTKEDKELRAEAGMNDKTVEASVSLVPRPASIVWSPGTCIQANQLGYDSSAELTFVFDLNKRFTKKLPTDLPFFSGGHNDLLAITLHKLVVNGAYKLVPLYSGFLTIICNISPYWRLMSLVAAVKLVNLFELFSSLSPRWNSIGTVNGYVSIIGDILEVCILHLEFFLLLSC